MVILCTLPCDVATGVCCTLLCFSSELRSAAKEKEEVLFLSAIVKGLIYHLTMEDTVCD